MLNSTVAVPMCATLGPASFVVTSAASINTDVQPLNGESGIEIVLTPSEVPAYNAAMEASFRRPTAAVADGQIVYVMTVEPNQEEYLPIGSALILYGKSADMTAIADALRQPGRAS